MYAGSSAISVRDRQKDYILQLTDTQKQQTKPKEMELNRLLLLIGPKCHFTWQKAMIVAESRLF
jgi:hypothetical protein